MAMVPLSPDDLDRAARSLRRTSLSIDVAAEREAHLVLAAFLDRAAAMDRAGPSRTTTIPDRVDLPS